MRNTKYTDQGRRVSDHWLKLAVTYELALQQFENSGIADDEVTVEDLHGLDMLHMGGVAATDEMIGMAQIQTGHRVLDVGSGVGGPARRLASKQARKPSCARGVQSHFNKK